MAQATNAFDSEAGGGIQRGRGGFYRSANDTPYVSHPSGELVKTGDRKGLPKRVAYGSPSGFGKQIENTTNLQKWGERRVVLGLGADLALIAACAELTKMEADSDEYKTAADRIIIAAKEAAEWMLAADRGTHGHAILEDDDEGRSWIDRAEAGELLGIPREAQQAIVEGWREMLLRSGLEILASEASVVDDRWKLAGTLDNLARLTKPLRFTLPLGRIVVIPSGTVVVLDKKTGKRKTNTAGIIQHWHGYAIQIASYAQSVPYDTEQESRGSWEMDISQNHGVIAHVDLLAAIEGAAASDIVSLVYVDLTAGREHGGTTCLEAKNWAKRSDLFSVAQLGDAASSDEDAILDTGHEEPTLPITTVTQKQEKPKKVPEPAVPITPAPSKLRSAQLERAKQIADADAARPTPGKALPEEGDDLSSAEFASAWDLLRLEFEKLEGDRAGWTSQLIRDARASGVPFQTGGGKTARRFDLYRAILKLAHCPDNLDDLSDISRALLFAVREDETVLSPSIPLGAAFGSCSATEAHILVDWVYAYIGGMLLCGFDENNRFVCEEIAANAEPLTSAKGKP